MPKAQEVTTRAIGSRLKHIQGSDQKLLKRNEKEKED
jgi:hypothetical protein